MIWHKQKYDKYNPIRQSFHQSQKHKNSRL
uniref:Uncharacterized protein n=1 Tax=Rhizophora mucronata TaxID=61149 RepID=A0A2P2PMZ1_RHIMU